MTPSGPRWPARDAWAFDPARMPRLKKLDPRLGDLAQNAAWRALLAWSRRQLVPRVFMTLVFQSAMLIVFTSDFSVLGGRSGLAFCFAATLASGMFALYHLIGVPGYEGCLELARRHDDWSSTTVTHRDLTLAVWGRLWLGSGPLAFAGVGVGSAGLAAALTRYPLDFGFLAMLASLTSGLMIGMAPFAGYVSLPMTLFWASGMAHGGRRKLTRLGFRLPPVSGGVGGLAGGWGWTARFFMGGMAFTLLIIAPACFWLWSFASGTASKELLDALKRHFVHFVAAAGFMGLTLGVLWGWWTRRASPVLLDRLTGRLGQIMELRRILRHEGRPKG